MSENWRSSRIKRFQVAAIAGLGLSADQRPGSHAALACRGPAASRCHSGIRPSAGHGLLARPHSSRDVLLPPPRHRRHHQRELRRRVDRPHHRAVRIRDGARIDVTRGAEGDAAAEARDERGQGRGVHARRTARSGARRAGRRRVARQRDRKSRAAVSPRGLVALESSQLGPHADSQAVQHGGAGRGRADGRAEGGVGGSTRAGETWNSSARLAVLEDRASECCSNSPSASVRSERPNV